MLHRVSCDCARNFAATPNNILEGHSSAMYVLDLVQERWSLIVTDDDSLIPTPRDKMAGWCYRKKLEFCIMFSTLLSSLGLSGIDFQQINLA